MTSPVLVSDPSRARPWRWVLGILVAAAALGIVSTVGWLLLIEPVPVHIVIDGVEHGGFDPSDLSIGARAAIVLVALLVVPLALLIGTVGAAIGLVVGIGVPLLLVLLVLAVVLSPVWLLAALLWWLWRRPARSGAA